MARKRKPKMEYRYYEIPAGSPVLALLGDKWVQNYGRDIDYLHFHNHLEVGFCYYGEGTVTFKEDIPFDGNMFTVIPKNFPHTTTSAGDSVSYWEWLFIDADKFLREVYKDNPRMAQKVLDRVNRRAHFVRVQDKPQIGALVQQIIGCMRERKEFYLEEVKGLTLALLLQVARWNREEAEKTEFEAGNSSLITPAIDYISECCDRPIKVEELAAMCHISETHLRRVFHDCMQMSPVEYINWVLIRTACGELKRTNDTVGDIAVRCGFSTLSTFNRNFHRIMGISPQQWRKDPEHFEQKLLKYDIKAEKGW